MLKSRSELLKIERNQNIGLITGTKQMTNILQVSK